MALKTKELKKKIADIANGYEKFDFTADRHWKRVSRGFPFDKQKLMFITISPPKGLTYAKYSFMRAELRRYVGAHRLKSLFVTEFADKRIHFHGLMDIHGFLNYHTEHMKDMFKDLCFIDIKPVTYLTGVIGYMTKDVFKNRMHHDFEPIGVDLQIPEPGTFHGKWEYKDCEDPPYVQQCFMSMTEYQQIYLGEEVDDCVADDNPTYHIPPPPHASPTGDGRGLPEEVGATLPWRAETDDRQARQECQF